MAHHRSRRAAQAVRGPAAGLIGLLLVTATPAGAQVDISGGVATDPGGTTAAVGEVITDVGKLLSPGGSPAVGRTPELSSLALFGTGAAGMAGYALTRMRGGRRRR